MLSVKKNSQSQAINSMKLQISYHNLKNNYAELSWSFFKTQSQKYCFQEGVCLQTAGRKESDHNQPFSPSVFAKITLLGRIVIQMVMLCLVDIQFNFQRQSMNVFTDIEYPEDPRGSAAAKKGNQQPKQQYSGKKRGRKPLKRGKGKKPIKHQHWTPVEQARYIDFVSKNRQLFDLELKEKKKAKIHLLMSRYIKVRDSYQCRSHHQKMLIKFGTVDNILKNCLEVSINTSTYSNDESSVQPDEKIVFVEEPEIVSPPEEQQEAGIYLLEEKDVEDVHPTLDFDLFEPFDYFAGLF